MRQEKEAAPAVADGVILAAEPGPVRARCCCPVWLFRSVPEWISDHRDRDLSKLLAATALLLVQQV